MQGWLVIFQSISQALVLIRPLNDLLRPDGSALFLPSLRTKQTTVLSDQGSLGCGHILPPGLLWAASSGAAPASLCSGLQDQSYETDPQRCWGHCSDSGTWWFSPDTLVFFLALGPSSVPCKLQILVTVQLHKPVHSPVDPHQYIRHRVT